MTAEAVCQKVLESVPFIRGVTVSGGECTLYPEFLTALFSLVKKQNLLCSIDSNGIIDYSAHSALMERCDGVMLDIKAWDKDVYKALTGGGDNSLILKNLRYLEKHNKLEELRIVVVPDYTDTKDILQGLKKDLGPETIARVPLKLIRFRPLGVRGAFSVLNPPSLKVMEGHYDYAQRLGFKNITVI
jgi:pyruvate formate lyase activating enzyme